MSHKTVTEAVEWVIQKFSGQGREPHYSIYSGPHHDYDYVKPVDDKKNDLTYLRGRQYLEVGIWEDE